jgi:hypothetical protein
MERREKRKAPDWTSDSPSMDQIRRKASEWRGKLNDPADPMNEIAELGYAAGYRDACCEAILLERERKRVSR